MAFEFDDEESRFDNPLAGEFAKGSEAEEHSELIALEGHNEEAAQNLWMVPFADLMSTLVILFLALFGYAYLGASTDYERALSAMQKEMSSKKEASKFANKEKEAEVAKALETYFNKDKLKGLAQVELSAHRIRVSLSNPVLFDSGRAELKPAAREALAEIAATLKTVPNAVVVEGHTDNVPVSGALYKSNFELSATRAFAVIEFFIQHGVDPARFSAYGYGEFHPVADNATPEGRGRNRRIEINIVRSMEKT
jgi:chemotaxis protein MotB